MIPSPPLLFLPKQNKTMHNHRSSYPNKQSMPSNLNSLENHNLIIMPPPLLIIILLKYVTFLQKQLYSKFKKSDYTAQTPTQSPPSSSPVISNSNWKVGSFVLYTRPRLYGDLLNTLIKFTQSKHYEFFPQFSLFTGTRTNDRNIHFLNPSADICQVKNHINRTPLNMTSKFIYLELIYFFYIR